MSYISKWRLQNNSVVPVGSNLFGTCNSSSSDTTKVVSLSAFNVLVEGVTIHVYFANANSGANTLLQVGSTSAQPIKRNGVAEGKWESGSVISFTYSEGYWVQNDADVGGGGGETYTLSKTGDTITLTGSGGDTSSVTDDDTTYGFSLSGHTLTITPSSGSPQTITLPDDNTTYTISISGNDLTLTPSSGTPQTIPLPVSPDTTYTISVSGHTLTLTPSSGTAQSITLPDDDTTYTISKSGNTVTLTGSDGSTSSITVTDDDTTYSISISGNTLTLTGSDGTTDSVTLPDDDTTYTFAISGSTLTITDSDGNTQTITLPDDNTTYTLSISGDVLTLTGSDGSTNTINLPKLKYTIDGADGLTTNNVIQNDVANNVADGGYALAEGQETTASGLRGHAEGYRTTASGSSSHAEGLDTEASGNHSHAEGNATESSGSGSHAEGSHTEASNDQAHAEGYYSKASGVRSHSTNHYTIAQRADQTAIGRFNEADTTGADETALGDYALIIGNGTADNARSNALAVKWTGDSEQQGRATTEDMTAQEIDDFVDGLNVSGLAAVDYIVEQGTSGIWTYRKWNSGVSECWGSQTVNTSWAVWTAPIYYGTTYTTNHAYPTGLFINKPNLNTSISGADYWICGSGTLPSATNTGRYYPVRVGTLTASNYTVCYHAIGRWK